MLTDVQRKQLLDLINPLVSAAIAEGVTPLIQAELKKATEIARDDDESYLGRILGGSSRSKDLIERGTKDKGIFVARIASCISMAKGNLDHAQSIAKKRYEDDMGDLVVKTLSSGDADSGGVFVPSNLASDFIDALRAKAQVRNAGPRLVDLTGGNLMVPGVATDATSGWVGEGLTRNASNPTTRGLNFTSKKLFGKGFMTQDLQRRSAQNADMILRDNLVKSMANNEDVTFLLSPGTEFRPKGMLYWAHADNTIDATQAGASATLDEVQLNLRQLIGLLTDNNASLDMAKFFLTFRSRNYLAFSLRDTEDTPVFKAELTAAAAMLNGQAALFTNNIPNNLGGGTNESKVFLTDMADAWLAEESGLMVRASNEASFVDHTGATVSAFDRGLSVVIIERNEDFAMAHDRSVAVLEAVKWGA